MFDDTTVARRREGAKAYDIWYVGYEDVIVGEEVDAWSLLLASSEPRIGESLLSCDSVERSRC